MCTSYSEIYLNAMAGAHYDGRMDGRKTEPNYIFLFNSFGAKFQTTFVVCFGFLQPPIGKKFICTVVRQCQTA